MSVYNLLVRIGGDAKGLTTAMDSAVGGVKSGFGDIAKIAGGTLIADAIGSATRSIIDFGKASIESLGRIQTINAQTEAAIRSTGNAAGVTLQQINDLSGSIENLTGIEAESIQQGQNLLLTFTNIRNAAGAGNDIFDRTTKIMTDLSVAFGSDTRSAAIQLGKALNDPIQGVTALQRVGISFSASQRDTIKALVESGNIMSAQKLILGELETQVGGSAMAYGQTMPGAIAKFNNALGNVGEALATSAIPLLTSLSIIGSEALNTLASSIVSSGVIGAFNQLVSPEIKAGIIGIAGAITIAMIPAMTAAAASAIATVAALTPIIATAAAIGGAAYIIIKNWEAIKQFFIDLGKGMRAIASGIYENFRRYFGGAIDFIGNLINGIIGAMKAIVGILPKQMQDAINGLKNVLIATPSAIQGGLDKIENAFKITADNFKPLLVKGIEAAEVPAKNAATKAATSIKKELEKPIKEVEKSYTDWNLTLGPVLSDVAATVSKSTEQLSIDQLKLSKPTLLDLGELKLQYSVNDTIDKLGFDRFKLSKYPSLDVGKLKLDYSVSDTIDKLGFEKFKLKQPSILDMGQINLEFDLSDPFRDIKEKINFDNLKIDQPQTLDLGELKLTYSVNETISKLDFDAFKIETTPSIDLGNLDLKFQLSDPFKDIKLNSNGAVEAISNLSQDLRDPLTKVRDQISEAFSPLNKLEIGLRKIGSVFNFDLVPQILIAINGLGDFVDGINDVATSIPKLLNNLPKIGDAISSSIGFLGSIVSTLAPVGEAIIGVAIQIGIAIASALGPFGLFIAAIVAINALLFGFKDAISGGLRAIEEFFNPALKDARLAAEKAAAQTKKFQQAYADMDKQFKRGEGLGRNFNIFSEQANIAKKAIEDLIADGLDPMNDMVGDLGNTLRRLNIGAAFESGALRGIQDSIRGFLDGAVTMADGLRIGIRNAILDGIVEAAMQGAIVRDAFRPLLDTLASQVASGAPMDAVRNTIQQIANQVPTVAKQLETYLSPLRSIVNELLPGMVPATAVAPVSTFTPASSGGLTVNVNQINANTRQDAAAIGASLVDELRSRGLR